MVDVVIQDYQPDQENEDFDPTLPEQVDREFMNKLAKMITRAEEALQAGEGNVDSDEFYACRGNFLDMCDDPEISNWLDMMRKQNRCPFRKFRLLKG